MNNSHSCVFLSLQGHEISINFMMNNIPTTLSKNHSKDIVMHICLPWHPVNMQIHTAACKQLSKEMVKINNMVLPIICLDYFVCEKYSSWKAGLVSDSEVVLI